MYNHQVISPVWYAVAGLALLMQLIFSLMLLRRTRRRNSSSDYRRRFLLAAPADVQTACALRQRDDLRTLLRGGTTDARCRQAAAVAHGRHSARPSGPLRQGDACRARHAGRKESSTMNPLPAVMACLLPVALYLSVRAFLRAASTTCRQTLSDCPFSTGRYRCAARPAPLHERHGTATSGHSRRNRRIDSRARYICRREEGGSCRTRTLDPPRMGGTRPAVRFAYSGPNGKTAHLANIPLLRCRCPQALPIHSRRPCRWSCPRNRIPPSER